MEICNFKKSVLYKYITKQEHACLFENIDAWSLQFACQFANKYRIKLQRKLRNYKFGLVLIVSV
jgi:hypothetical protein